MAVTLNHVTVTTRRSRTGLWIALAGALIAVAGLITMHIASGRRAYAETVNGFRRAMGDPFDDPQVAAAVTLGHIGLGILIFGAALLLVGIATQAMRR